MTDDFIPNKLAAVGMVRAISPEITRPSDDELLALANHHALREIGDDEDRPWFCPVTISSDQVDSHFTYMDVDTTLTNFVDEAGGDRGVSVLDSHDNKRQAFGRSITGELTEDSGINLVASWFYTVPGIMTSSGMRTDDYIKSIERGISKEISVGFNFREDGKVECSICGLNMMSWDCPHFPGRKYMHPVDPDDAEGAQMESVAVGRILNGHLAEYSFVYKGSNRESQTLRLPEAKARMFTAGGMIGEKEAFALERAYDIDLHPWIQGRVYPSAVPGAPGANSLLSIEPTKERSTVATTPKNVSAKLEWSPGLREAFTPLFTDGEGVPEDPAQAIRLLADTIADYNDLQTERDEAVSKAQAGELIVRELNDKVEELTPLAADGEAYRKDLIEEAIKEGIRAMDPDDENPFPEDDIREMLNTSTIKAIKAYRDTNRRNAERNYPEGRQSRETLDSKNTNGAKDGEPVEAYQSGRGRR